MSDLVNGIRQKLQQAGLKESHLESPGAHVLVSDDEDNLHVLVKASAAEKVGLDGIQAELTRKDKVLRTVQVERAEATIDLGELGEWRDFVVPGLTELKKTLRPDSPLELQLFSAGGGAEPGAAFYTTLDLAFALHEVLERQEVAVRPVPPGERDGKVFLELGPALRQQVEALIGRRLDQTAPAETVGAAFRRWQELTESVASSGLVGAALSLGVAGEADVLPKVRLEAKAAETGELSAGLRDYLTGRGVEIATTLTAGWAEAALDALPEDAPETLAGELRELYGALSNREEAAVDDLFGDELGGAAKGSGEVPVDTRLDKARRLRLAQLEAGVAGLGVSDAITGRLADLMTAALVPSKKPSIVIVAGPAHSAADRMFDLAVAMVGKRPLEIGREDLAEEGFPSVYGNIKGVPTMADAILSERRLLAHKDDPGRHTPVVVRNLEATGGFADLPTDERRAVLVDWLERVRTMSFSGKVNTFSKQKGGASESGTVELPNTVFLLRWQGDPAGLAEVLAGSQRLASMSAKVVEVPALDAKSGVAYLEQELGRALPSQGLAAAKVAIGEGLRAGLLAAYAELGAGPAFERFRDRLFTELADFAGAQPAAEYAIEFSKKLTKREREKILAGQPIPFAARLYEFEAAAPR